MSANACLRQLLRFCIIQPMKLWTIVAVLMSSLSATGQKHPTNAPGVLLHGEGQRGTLRVVLTGRDGMPARNVGVMVVWSCAEGCPLVVSSMLTDNVGEFELNPITVGRYIVCSNSDVDSSLPCFIDAAAAYCTAEITPESPKVELRMQVSRRGITPPEPQARCRQTASGSH